MGGASSCRIARSRPCDILLHGRRSGRRSRRRVSTGGVVDSGRDGVDVGGTGCSSTRSRSSPHRLRASVGRRDGGDEHLGRGYAWKRRRSTSLQLEGLRRAWQHQACCFRRLAFRGSDGAVADRVGPTSRHCDRRLEVDGLAVVGMSFVRPSFGHAPTGPRSATVTNRRMGRSGKADGRVDGSLDHEAARTARSASIWRARSTSSRRLDAAHASAGRGIEGAGSGSWRGTMCTWT